MVRKWQALIENWNGKLYECNIEQSLRLGNGFFLKQDSILQLCKSGTTKVACIKFSKDGASEISKTKETHGYFLDEVASLNSFLYI